MKKYKITSTIPIKGKIIETYILQAESEEDAEHKFINNNMNTGYFIDSHYEDIKENITDCKSLEIEEINEKI